MAITALQRSSEQEPRPPLSLMSGTIADLWRTAEGSALGPVAQYDTGRGPRFLEATSEHLAKARNVGSSEIYPLSNDLLLLSNDLRGFAPSKYECGLSGLLYLHFRLDGLSEEEILGGSRSRLDGGCFLLCTSTQPISVVREVVGDTWRTVAIACRPEFAQQELGCLGDSLPKELRSFRAGDNVEFAFVGEMTREMRIAVQSLVQTTVPQEIRKLYLRAKVVELVCLALARMSVSNQVRAALPVRLSRHDIQCIHNARRLLLTDSPARPLASLARQVGLNRTKLALGFKLVFGVTIGEFDRELRLERAHRLLQGEDLPISYVATLAGYADPGSFSKAFKLEYGILPSELRSTASPRK